MATTRRRLAAIMFTDMVGYSAKMQANEAEALESLALHNALLRPVFAIHRGREVKSVGDAFLVEFDSALDAARCAVEVQRLLQDHNAAQPAPRRIQVRIGIHIGDVEESDGDVLGDAVNIASRIEPLAEPGGICVSQQVFDQVQNKLPATFVKVPSPPLKNIRTPVSVYRLAAVRERPRTDRPSDRSEGHSLAVLPLANISPDAADEYFADGLTEEIISTLSQVPDLRVIARTSVLPYKSASKPISQIGAELGVDTILEGSVRKAGNRVRIALQLVDVGTQHHKWASSYNREIGDVFAVQTDIAERTADALRVQLARRAGASDGRRPTSNPEAYDVYLRGLVAASEPEARGFDEAVRCFERATQLDPTFAEAYAQWADLYVVAAGDYISVREALPKARPLAARALELDPESSDAHTALGNILLQFDHDWTTAEEEFQRAIALNPSNVTALRYFGMLLRTLGRFEEAKEVVRQALRLDPISDLQATLAWIELESGNFEVAVASAEQARDRHPSRVSAHVYLGLTYLAAGRRADALREAGTPLGDANDIARFDLALLNALVGRPQQGREVAAEVERGEEKSYTSPAHLAMLYSAMGELDKAIDLLEKDYREGDQILWLYYRGVFFDPIRGDPRFQALVDRFGLPAVPVNRGS